MGHRRPAFLPAVPLAVPLSVAITAVVAFTPGPAAAHPPAPVKHARKAPVMERILRELMLCSAIPAAGYNPGADGAASG